MPSATLPAASATPLFQLGTVAVAASVAVNRDQTNGLKTDRPSTLKPSRWSTTASLPMRPRRIGNQNSRDSSAKILRVDGPEEISKPLSSTFQSTERRLSRMLGERRPDTDQEKNAAWFPGHAGDLIQRLRHWSLELDRRESQLDSLERELNQRQRLLRQQMPVQ